MSEKLEMALQKVNRIVGRGEAVGETLTLCRLWPSPAWALMTSLTGSRRNTRVTS